MLSLHRIAAVVALSGLVAGLLGVPHSRADDAASTCANTTVNGIANDCYTITPPFNDGAGITVNGVEGGGEWAGATTKNLVGAPTGSFKALRSGSAIYVLITVNDATYNAADQIRVFVDPLHNHATTADDIEFRIVRDTGGSPNHRKITGAGDVAWNPATLGSQLGTSSGVGAWVVELKLTAAELGLSDLPPILGFGIQAEDNPASNLALWPANLDNLSPATTWANFKTRYPIEYMLVLDRSGSMLSQNKWNDAKKATNFFANTMSILRDATYFDDKLGAVTFSYSCFGSTDETVVAKPLVSLGAFPRGNYADAAPALVAPGNCTPIGSGMNSAFGALGIGVEESQRVALLMSDGLHNRPTSAKGSPADLALTYSACNAGAWSMCASSNIQVNTVALGQDSGVDTNLLNQIKNHFSGAFASTYNITTNVEDLKETFISSLDNLYQMNLAAVGASGSEFMVDPKNRKLIVVLSWTTPAGAVTFKLQQKTNPGDPWTNVNCGTSGSENVAVGYAICAVNEPAAGTWRAVDNMNNPLMTADRQFVLLDLNLRARFAVDQVVHGTGVDIVLTADINQAGLPVTNDAGHPVSVTVSIDKPGEGFGTFVSTHTPDACKQIEPQLPPRGAQLPQTGFTTSSAATAKPAASAGGTDPAAARFLLMEQLLKICGKNGLARAQDPGLQLYDDGTHGDLTPNDGVYTLRFTNTQYEGSYLFRFNAEGTTQAGNRFTRTKRMAEYVRVEVDPASTPLNSQVLGQAGNVTTRLYYVTPRDRFGGYLGPGYPEQIQFQSAGGVWLNAVTDHDNGIYSQVLRYDVRQGEPQVTPIVQGKVVGKPGPVVPWWLCLLVILILIAIIIALLLKRLLR